MPTLYGDSRQHLNLWLLIVFCCQSRAYLRPSYCDDQKNRKNSFLWKIDHPDLRKPSYFFGTIHVPYHEVWDYASPSVRETFSRSNSVYFELDLSDYKTLKSLAVCQLLPGRDHLSDYLPPELYERINNYLAYIKESMPVWLSTNRYLKSRKKSDLIFKKLTGNWQRKRPIWLLLMLNSLDGQQLRNARELGGRRRPVLDQFLAQQAQAASKHVGAIEKVQEQCDPLNSLNLEQVLFALDLTLSRLEATVESDGRQWPSTDDSHSPSASLRNLVEHYNCGSLDEQVFNRDTVALPMVTDSHSAESKRHLVERAKSINRHFKVELITKRNVKMAERTILVLRNDPSRSYFFAFGAGHFLGDESVIELVKTAGYQVTQISDNYDGNENSESGVPSSLLRIEAKLSSFPPQPQHRRRFQDLWIKMDSFTSPPTKILSAGYGNDGKQSERLIRNGVSRLFCSNVSLTLTSIYLLLLYLRPSIAFQH